MKTNKNKEIKRVFQSANKDCTKFSYLIFMASEADKRGNRRLAEKLRNDARAMVNLQNAEEIKDFLLHLADINEMESSDTLRKMSFDTGGGTPPQGGYKDLPLVHCTKKHRVDGYYGKKGEQMHVTRHCEICGKVYWTRNGKSKYCSDACKKVARAAQHRKFLDSHPEYDKGKLWREKNADKLKEYQAKRTSSEEYKAKRRDAWRKSHGLELRIFNCPVCGVEIKTYRKSQFACCSEHSAAIRSKIKREGKETKL